MKLIDPSHDLWTALPADEAPTAPRAHLLLSLTAWRTARRGWPAGLPVGVSLVNTDEIRELSADLQRVDLITLEFPKWTDGRAYSQARLLRARLRFRGEIRAVGQVLVDMLPLLQRTGFDAAVMRPDQNADAARRALSFFSGHYQADPRTPAPLSARQAA